MAFQQVKQVLAMVLKTARALAGSRARIASGLSRSSTKTTITYARMSSRDDP
jgi:hypothetical protein